jgi:hypothetical protein
MGATKERLSAATGTAGGWFTSVLFFMRHTIMERSPQ